MAGALVLFLALVQAGSATPPVDGVLRGPSVQERLAEIQERIQAAVRYPPLARQQGLEGVAHVRFAIEHGGEPVEVQVARSSGYHLLDEAAERSVDAAAPLPWIYGQIEVPVRFQLDDAH